MEDKTTKEARPCPKDCRRCGMQQQVFCAAQMAFTSFEQMNVMKKKIEKIGSDLEGISQKIEAIQSSEAVLSVPLSEAPAPTLFPME